MEIREEGVPASEASGVFVGRSTAESEKTEVKKEELRRAGVEVIGWVADDASREERSFPGVEDNGTEVGVAALRSRVKAGVRGVAGPVVVLAGGGPGEEVSRGSAGVEVCRGDVEAHVEL